MANDLGLSGLDFIEFASPNPQQLEDLFLAFGFSKTKKHQQRQIEYFNQNDIHFFLNREGSGHSFQFAKDHGPSISAMGWRFKDPKVAYELAIQRGAKPGHGELQNDKGEAMLAIQGIGGMLIYFLDEKLHQSGYKSIGFIPHPQSIQRPPMGFLAVDHLTNNVARGEMAPLADFYKNVFGFTEVRYFDIRGAKTGLTSFALKSPDGSFCIPINEGTDSKSQINEYLEEYKGPGVQHLAFLTENILDSLDALEGSKIETLDIDDEYYAEIFDKIPNVREDHKRIKGHNVLVDGDDEGYLLQIFTKNIIGPIFIELIQRENHHAFGEGNFGALFRSIERDQMKRGYLKV